MAELKNAMSLVEQYQALLTEYDKVLNLSKRILVELRRGGTEREILILLEEKKAAGQTVTCMAKRLSSSKIEGQPGHNSQSLSEMKSVLGLITEKARHIQEIEQKIRDFLKDSDHQSE
ncbi:MAG: hypothetical protein WCE90_09810 [Candidatus Zixiibacteriota bacterium]